MNFENMNEGNIFNINLRNQGKKNNNSVINKANLLTRKPNMNIPKKNYILKLLNTNANDQMKNQIYKINSNSNISRINIKNSLNEIHNKNNEEFISDKYKIKLKEKNDTIHNLINEIDYYKNCINNKNKNQINNNLNIINIYNFSPKKVSNLNDLSIGKSKKFEQYYTLDNDHRKNIYKIKNSSLNNNINILFNDNNSVKNIFKRYKYKFPELKKNKLFTKKSNNLTQENNIMEYNNISKINILKSSKRNDTFNTIDYNNNERINNCYDNEDNVEYKNQKMKMEDLNKRFNNLVENLFSIIEKKKND